MKKHISIKFYIQFLCQVLITLLFLTGCSADGLLHNSKKNESTINTKAEKTSLKGNLELQIFVGGYGDVWWKEAIDGFKKENPELNIIANMGPNINEEMKSRWMSGDPPDFVYVDGNGFPAGQLEEDGRFMDLKVWLDTTKAADGKSIREHLMKGMIKNLNGKEYFAPYILNTMALFYDRKLLEDNNIEPPSDFDEFVEAGITLKSKGIGLMTYAGKYPGYLWVGFVLPALVSEGGEQLLSDVVSCKPGIFVSQPFKNVMKKIEILRDKGLFMKGTTDLDHIQSQKQWLNRKAAFIPNGMWIANEMKGNIPNDFIIKFTPAPLSSKGQKFGINAESASFAISSKAKNPENAKTWLAYLYREETVTRFIEICGAPTVYNVDLSKVKTSELVKSVMGWISDPRIVIATTSKQFNPTIARVAYDTLTPLVLGQKSAEEYCNILQKEADKLGFK